MPLQFRATIFAMRERWTFVFRFAESAPSGSSLDCTDRGVAENNFCRLIGHTQAMLQNYFARVDSA